jgi:Hypothetical glycosyl hydrolase family 15
MKMLAMFALALAAIGAVAANADAWKGVRYGRVANARDSDFSNIARSAKRHKIWVLQSWRTDIRDQIDDRRHRVLVYKGAHSCSWQAGPNGEPSAGILCRHAKPWWYLHKKGSGGAILYDHQGSHSGGNPIMDMGNRGYQRAWVKAVIADAKGHGWEGVHIDNVDLRCFCDGRPREYPTERSYQKATESFIRFVYPRLHRAGLYVQVNVGNGGSLESWRNTKTTCKKYVPYMDGYSQQSFMTNDSWRRQVHLIRCIQKQHKFLLGRSPVEPERLRYGLGVMLLLSKGHSAVGGDLTPLDLWPSYYRKAQRFGRPLGHARTLRNGTKVRRFKGGHKVIVNPVKRTARLR